MKKILVEIQGGTAFPSLIEDGVTLIIRDLDTNVQETYLAENDELIVSTQQLDDDGNVIETTEENGE